MSKSYIRHLLTEGTSHVEHASAERLKSVSLLNGRITPLTNQMPGIGVEDHLSGQSRTSSLHTNILFVHAEREYRSWDHPCSIALRPETWSRILSQADVLPSFVEVYSTNDSGRLSHLSYGSASTDRRGGAPTRERGAEARNDAPGAEMWAMGQR